MIELLIKMGFLRAPKKGDTFCHRDHYDNPFDRSSIEVKEYKNGWVLYDMRSGFKDQSMCVSHFFYIYKRITDD